MTLITWIEPVYQLLINIFAEQLQKVIQNLKSGGHSEDYQQDLETKKQELDNELQLRSAQITDIQQRCLDDADCELILVIALYCRIQSPLCTFEVLY